MVREFLCADGSRSGLDRCLRRYGVGGLQEAKPAKLKAPHKVCGLDYLHMDIKYLPHMQDETKRRYLFVAID